MTLVKSTVTLPKRWQADDGTECSLRQLADADAQALIDFVKSLSFAARYFRFGDADHIPGEETLKACALAPEQGVHLIAVTQQDGGEIVIGSARYVIQPDSTRCEFVIVVADQWKHHGVGHALMNTLLDCAKNQGIATMVGRILQSNRDMIEFVRSCGFEISDSPENDWMKIATIKL